MKVLILPLAEADPDALYLEPREYFDEAILGVTSQPDKYHDTWHRVSNINVIVYDVEMAIEAIMKWHDCHADDAEEWFYYNTNGAWMGEGTPTFYSDDYNEDEDIG